MSKIPVGVAMSGGVDSTVAVALLREQGYAVTGFFMRLPVPAQQEQLARTRWVARRLGVPLVEVDFRELFAGQVRDAFLREYLRGRTPNPCIRCNRLIKFGRLLEVMREQGMKKMATGHYVRIEQVDGAGPGIFRGRDPVKDQSYFLCQLDRSVLPWLLFPLGEYDKQQVYARARLLGFSYAAGDESQDVCFLGQGMERFFVDQGIGSRPGPIVTRKGDILGSHRGVWHYTIGQRRGLRIPDVTPWYVVGLDPSTNQVIAGKEEDLYCQTLFLAEVRWLMPADPEAWSGQVQLRSRHKAAFARVSRVGGRCWRVCFQVPQRAVTPGQFAAFYEDDRLVGSGCIVCGP